MVVYLWWYSSVLGSFCLLTFKPAMPQAWRAAAKTQSTQVHKRASSMLSLIKSTKRKLKNRSWGRGVFKTNVEGRQQRYAGYISLIKAPCKRFPVKCTEGQQLRSGPALRSADVPGCGLSLPCLTKHNDRFTHWLYDLIKGYLLTLLHNHSRHLLRKYLVHIASEKRWAQSYNHNCDMFLLGLLLHKGI